MAADICKWPRTDGVGIKERLKIAVFVRHVLDDMPWGDVALRHNEVLNKKFVVTLC